MERELLLQRVRTAKDPAERVRSLSAAAEHQASAEVRELLAQAKTEIARAQTREKYEALIFRASEAQKAGNYFAACNAYRKARDLMDTPAAEQAAATLLREHGGDIRRAEQAEALKEWEKQLRVLEEMRARYEARADRLREERRFEELKDLNEALADTDRQIRLQLERKPQ